MKNKLFPIRETEYSKSQIFKNQIASTGNKLGLFIFLYYFLLILFSNIFKFLLIDFFPELLQNMNTDIKYEFISIFSAILATIIPLIICSVLSKDKIKNIINLKKIKISYLFPVVFVGMAVSMVANFASDILATNFSLFNLKNTVSFSNQTNSTKDVIIYIISTAIIPAICEELIFRGVFLGILRKYGDCFAIIASSLVFAGIHGNISQIPFTFIFGLILAFSVCKTNSILPAIIIHFINNLYSVIMDIIRTSEIFTDNIYVSVYYLIIALFCTLGIISFIFLIVNNKLFFQSTDYAVDISISLKNKMLSFTLNPGILLTFTLFITITISNTGII